MIPVLKNNVNLQIRETDLDELERVVGVVAFGDLEAEDTRNLNQLNFQRLLRLSQLATEYLLHVQDRLAYDNGKLKVSPHDIYSNCTHPRPEMEFFM